MKIITDIEEANILLKSYKGATLQITMYSLSLKRIALKLTLPNVSEVVYIVGISCESINGRFSFTEANLNISVEFSIEGITIISDKLSGFSLITSGGFSLAQGIESEFGESFDNFIIDK